MDDYAIIVDDLRKRYGDLQAVDGVSFAVARGEVFGILGPNGAGKTTTIECIEGLRRPDSGDITVLGVRDGATSHVVRQRVGVQLQTTGLYPKLTTGEIVELYADFYDRSLPIERLLDLVGLLDMRNRRNSTLSGGQKQRLSLALALVNEPELAFLDEPTTGLDPQSRRGLWDIIRGLKAQGRTVLLTTHYMEEAAELCDRVAIMDQGRIIELDSPRALVQKHFRETAIDIGAAGDIPRRSLAALSEVANVTEEEGRYTLYSADVPRTMAALFALAERESTALSEVVIRQATLEDVFLKITGRRIR